MRSSERFESSVVNTKRCSSALNTPFLQLQAEGVFPDKGLAGCAPASMLGGQRVRHEKPHHLFAGVRTGGIGVRTPRAAARPGMAGAMHRPVLGHQAAARFLEDGFGCAMN